MFYEILIIFTCINLVVDIFGSELLVGDLQNLGLDLAPPYINIYILIIMNLSHLLNGLAHNKKKDWVS